MQSHTVNTEYNPNNNPMFALVQAHYALQQGGEKQAKKAMQSALQLCKQQGDTTLRLMHPRYLKDLLLWSYQQGIEKEYVEQSLKTLTLNEADIIDITDHIDKHIKISTLGNFTVQVGEQTLSYTRAGYSKPFDMLKALIAFGGQQVNRAKIIDTLWPDAEGDCARRNFDTTLHRLRKLLQHNKALVLHGSQLTLDTRYVWVDIWEFERTFNQLDSECHKLSCGPATMQLLTDKFLSLYQGHFLQNDHVRPWTLAMRENLSNRFIHLLVKIGRYWHQHNEPEKAIMVYQRGIELDSTAENLYQNLMRIYIEQGTMAQAASTYLRCRKALATQLKVSPSSETVRLYKLIGTEQDCA